jgi:hypothetical protein
LPTYSSYKVLATTTLLLSSLLLSLSDKPCPQPQKGFTIRVSIKMDFLAIRVYRKKKGVFFFLQLGFTPKGVSTRGFSYY